MTVFCNVVVSFDDLDIGAGLLEEGSLSGTMSCCRITPSCVFLLFSIMPKKQKYQVIDQLTSKYQGL